MDFPAHQENPIVKTAADVCVSRYKPVEKSGALLSDVQGRRVAKTQLMLKKAPGTGKKRIRTQGRENNDVDIFRLPLGFFKSDLGGFESQIRCTHIPRFRYPVALFDPRTLLDPFIRRFHPLGQIVVGDQPLRNISARALDNRLSHMYLFPE